MPLGLALQCKKSCHTKMSEAGQHLCILYHKHLDLREWHSVLLSTPTPSCTSSTLRCGCRDRQSYPYYFHPRSIPVRYSVPVF